ncbi:hypothetical protein ACFOGG_04525 [Brenneria rubrifaciens]|uniref:hypothetical protein n=1 Tax=Brenneria rubrifaciens TaxID=55213 RepID=UPI0026AB3C3C
MRRCTDKIVAADVGYQPQLPSGSQPAFSSPLLNRSFKKAPQPRGFFLPVINGSPNATFVYPHRVYRANR